MSPKNYFVILSGSQESKTLRNTFANQKGFLFLYFQQNLKMQLDIKDNFICHITYDLGHKTQMVLKRIEGLKFFLNHLVIYVNQFLSTYLCNSKKYK